MYYVVGANNVFFFVFDITFDMSLHTPQTDWWTNSAQYWRPFMLVRSRAERIKRIQVKCPRSDAPVIWPPQSKALPLTQTPHPVKSPPPGQTPSPVKRSSTHYWQVTVHWWC